MPCLLATLLYQRNVAANFAFAFPLDYKTFMKTDLILISSINPDAFFTIMYSTLAGTECSGRWNDDYHHIPLVTIWKTIYQLLSNNLMTMVLTPLRSATITSFRVTAWGSNSYILLSPIGQCVSSKLALFYIHHMSRRQCWRRVLRCQTNIYFKIWNLGN
jgi:hypothetical protein